ncbi:MAG: acetyl-CoA decarbonylase/synthase complex subunit delta [Candidatus Omnitrophica bacterium]|nr:acetyl-CoA decarbonylase/synthase complex subunit delta [Candidatus Omnitrophota bacterium]
MASQLMLENWAGEVYTLSIGANKASGGTRENTLTVGGEKALPFLFEEGAIPNKPQVVFEIWDSAPSDWPDELVKPYKDVFSDPLAWADKCVKEYKAKALCVRLQAAHPDFGNKPADSEAKLISSLLKKVGVPLIILGCGDDAKDNIILPACSEAAKGEKCLIGSAVQDNYKTIAASVLADGHSIIAESPIDINIAKQLNILISDMGLPLDRIVINPTIGALGYGLEYAYSIMERARLAALSGDKTVANPFICFVAQESWRAKEAKVSHAEFPSWGMESERGIAWEIITATALIQAGADILVMRHPKAIEKVNMYLDNLFINTKR